MKSKEIINIILVTSILFFVNVFSNGLYCQGIHYKTSTVLYEGDSVMIIMDNIYRGVLQWQRSYDSDIWNDMEGENNDTLLFYVDSSSYYRAAITEETCDTVYSDIVFLQVYYHCIGTSTVSDFDNNIYNTVQIGDQCWMKENLRTTNYADGTALVDGTSVGSISGDYTSKYYL